MSWCAGQFGWLPSQTRGESYRDLCALAERYVPAEQVKNVTGG